jgi:hypothetical protein
MRNVRIISVIIYELKSTLRVISHILEDSFKINQFESVYFHGRVLWLVFVTTIKETCSVREGEFLGLLKDNWTPIRTVLYSYQYT